MLRVILTNPQFLQALFLAASMGRTGPRSVNLPVPSGKQPRQRRPVQVPLGAVMNAIAMLARQSMVELNATTREDEPEVPSYLVDEEGEYVVNPTDANARARLVTRLFALSEQTDETEAVEDVTAWSESDEADAELDESDEWAEDAGFTM